MASMYQKKMRVRKLSDLDRLAKQYAKDAEKAGAEYQQSFAEYEKSVAAKMAPYEADVKRYQTEAMPAFESAKAAYQGKLDQYNTLLAEIAKDPVIEKSATAPVPLRYIPLQETYKTYEKKPIPKFTETAPTAPSAPVKPEIAEFDETKFESKRKQLAQDYQREVGERRAARLSAVSRQSARPLMRG